MFLPDKAKDCGPQNCSPKGWKQKEPDYLTKGWEGNLWARRRNSALGAVHKWPDLHEKRGGTKRTNSLSVNLPLLLQYPQRLCVCGRTLKTIIFVRAI